MLIFAGCSEMKLLGVERDEDLKLFTEAEIALMKYTDMDFTYIQPEAFKQASDIAKAFDEIDGKKRIVKPPIIINLPRQKQDYIKLDSTPEIYIYNFEPYLGKSLLQIQTENISVCYTT